MSGRLRLLQRLHRRVQRRFYRCLFRLYRTIFPTSNGRGVRLRAESLSRVLIIRHDRIGDMIVTTPVLSLLADVAPQAEVDVLASPTNAVVLAADRRVHRVFVRTGWRDWLLLFPQLRRRRYDAVYSFIYGRGLREGLIASAIARHDTRKISVMRPPQYRGLFTSVIRVPRSVRHMTEHLLYVVRATLEPTDERIMRPHPVYIAIDAAAEAAASAFLAEHRLGDFVVVNIAAAEPWRELPWSNCVEVLRALLPRWPEVTFVLVPPADKLAAAERVVDACASDRVILFPPADRFLDLVALVGRARLVLTSDTANVHIASACGRPVVALYSDRSTKVELWTPFGVPSRSIVAGSGQPISTIPAEQIVHACEELYVEAEPLRASNSDGDPTEGVHIL